MEGGREGLGASRLRDPARRTSMRPYFARRDGVGRRPGKTGLHDDHGRTRGSRGRRLKRRRRRLGGYAGGDGDAATSLARRRFVPTSCFGAGGYGVKVGRCEAGRKEKRWRSCARVMSQRLRRNVSQATHLQFGYETHHEQLAPTTLPRLTALAVPVPSYLPTPAHETITTARSYVPAAPSNSHSADNRMLFSQPRPHA